MLHNIALFALLAFSAGIAFVDRNPTPISSTPFQVTQQTPRINIEEKAERSPKNQDDADRQPTAALGKTAESDTTANANKGDQEGTEFFPAFMGVRLKITDSLLVIFTFALAVSTVALWRTTRDSVRIAERALTELERPFLYVEITKPGLEIRDQFNAGFQGKPAVSFKEFEITFLNVGRTPAILTRIEYDLRAAATGAMPDLVNPADIGGREIPVGVISTADRPFRESPNIRWQFTFEEREAIAERKSSVWIIGFVRYTSAIQSCHITGFAQVYDPLGDRYVTRGDARYNYASTEDERYIPPPSKT